MRVTGSQHIPHPDDAAPGEADAAHQAKLRIMAAAIAAETRAQELVEALTNAVNGAPRWRPQAQELLRLVAGGIMKPPKETE